MKKSQIFVLVLEILIAISGVAFLIAWAVNGEVWHKPLSYLATIALPFVPALLTKISKFKFSDRLVIAYEIFLIFAMVVGIDLDFYKTFLVIGSDSYYDKIVHLASGVLTAIMAKEILDAQKFKKSSPFFNFLFMVGMTTLVGVLWECFEFGYDQIFHQSMQELVSSGVADTMWDLIAALGGGVVTGIILRKNK